MYDKVWPYSTLNKSGSVGACSPPALMTRRLWLGVITNQFTPITCQLLKRERIKFLCRCTLHCTSI